MRLGGLRLAAACDSAACGGRLATAYACDFLVFGGEPQAARRKPFFPAVSLLLRASDG
jgi:hypothetical protein